MTGSSIRPYSLEVDHLILDADSVGVLLTLAGERIVINHPLGYRLETLAERGLVDAVIVDAEDGFSQLGGMRHFLSRDLGLVERNLVKYVLDGFPDELERNISSFADWNRARTPEVTLVAIPSERQGSHLRGLILAPYDGSECYKQFSVPTNWRTHRDFMYNVTYEAIAYAYTHWGARRIGITHFSRGKYGGEYRRDLTTCQVEAMAHFCADHEGVESFTFLDDTKGNQPLEIVEEFNADRNLGEHRRIFTKSTHFWGIDFVDLEWVNEESSGTSGFL